MVVWLFLAQFWTQVVRRPNDSVGHVLRLVEELGDTKVSDFNLVIFCQENICGLDVSVQNFVAMEIPEAKANFDEEAPDLCLYQLPPHLLLQVLA